MNSLVDLTALFAVAIILASCSNGGSDYLCWASNAEGGTIVWHSDDPCPNEVRNNW